jgi:hypothetical protein
MGRGEQPTSHDGGDAATPAGRGGDVKAVLFWMAVGAAFLGIDLVVTGGLRRFNDDFQYLSVADNLVRGKGAATSILYFDEHYISGTLPAPQTVFPCGYSLAVAAVHLLGVPLFPAGVIVSVLSFLAMIPLLWWGCRLMHVGPVATHGVLFLVVANSLVWRFALSASSEALFSLLLLLAATLMMQAELAGANALLGRRRSIFLAGLATGLSFLVRYAGSFVAAGGCCYYLGRALLKRTRQHFADLLWYVAPVLAVSAWIFLRNWMLTGSLKGGNIKRFDHPLGELLQQVQVSWIHLFVGEDVDKSDLANPLLLSVVVLVGLGMALAVLAYLLGNRTAVVANLRRGPVVPCVFLVVFYMTGMLYAGKTTAISLFEPRMFSPLLPLVLLLLGSVFPCGSLAWPPFRLAGSALLLVAGALYAASHVVSTARAHDIADFTDVVRALSEPGSDGQPLGEWVQRHVPVEATLIASNGQGCGGILQRNTIALANLHYSEQPWSEARLRDVSTRYGARFLFLFPHSRDTQCILKDSPFLKQVLDGAGPTWLALVAGNSHCRIYALQPDLHVPRACLGR